MFYEMEILHDVFSHILTHQQILIDVNIYQLLLLFFFCVDSKKKKKKKKGKKKKKKKKVSKISVRVNSGKKKKPTAVAHTGTKRTHTLL